MVLVLIIVTENREKPVVWVAYRHNQFHLHPPAAPPTVRTLKSSKVRG